MSSVSWCKRLFPVVAVVFGICLGVPSGDAYSEERELQGQRSAIDAVLLVDSSGSMMVTDPLRLRYEGAKLLLQFLGAEDRLAIVSFSGDAKVIRPLTPYGASQRDQVIQEIESLKTEGRFTDLLEAVKMGDSLLKAEPRENAQRIMILLSDGKMEPDPAIGFPAARTQELVSNILPELKSQEIKVYTLSFSDQADQPLLGEIASSTDGLNWFTAKPDDIHKSFANLFLTVKRPQVVPLTSRGFTIDNDVQEATFYITHPDGAELQLESPEGGAPMTAADKLDSISWFRGQNFDVITLQNPDPGDWRVQGMTAGEGFATVLTNLKLVTDWPSLVRADEPVVIQARLYEAEKPVSLPEMSGVIKYAFQITPTDKISEPIIKDFLVDDGTGGDRVEKDGIFSKTVRLKDPGEYKLNVIARAPTFQRTQQVPFRVKPQLLRISVVMPDSGKGEHHEEGAEGEDKEGHDAHHGEGHSEESDTSDEKKGDESNIIRGDGRAILRVELSSELAGAHNLEVRLTAKTGERKRYDLPLRRSPVDPLVYDFPAQGLPKDDRYLLEATLKGETKKRQEIEAESKPVYFERAPVQEKKSSEVTVKLLSDEQPVKPVSNFPLYPLIAVTAGNAFFAFAAMTFLKRSQSGGVPTTSRYSPPSYVTEIISTLEARARMTDIDLKDPMFADDGEQPPAAVVPDLTDPPPSAPAEDAEPTEE